MMKIRRALSIAVGAFVMSGAFAAPAQANCCQGYCACTDWQTGGSYNGCTITYNAEGGITDVQCAYITMQCC